MNNSTIVWIVIVVLVVLGLGWYVMAQNSSTDVTPSEQTADTTGSQNTNVPASPPPQTVSVTYTDQGFTPASVNLKVGDTVTFVNQSTKKMWVASNQHPTHTEYDGTSRTTHCVAGYTGPKPFDECATGDSYSFTFTQVGTTEYHNHINATDIGTVVVQ